jgi:hypothetical protein
MIALGHGAGPRPECAMLAWVAGERAIMLAARPGDRSPLRTVLFFAASVPLRRVCSSSRVGSTCRTGGGYSHHRESVGQRPEAGSRPRPPDLPADGLFTSWHDERVPLTATFDLRGHTPHSSAGPAGEDRLRGRQGSLAAWGREWL